MAHNGAGFDNHYLFHYLISDFGLTVDPIYSGSNLLQFTVKKSANDRDYLIRGIDSAQFFLAQLKSLPKQFGLDTSDFKRDFSLTSLISQNIGTMEQVSRHFLLCS